MDNAIHRLEVEAVDLGPEVRAVGLELIDPETREPVTGSPAAAIWAATLRALAGEEPWVIDFFAHLDRVRDFCLQRAIDFREPNARTLIVTPPSSAEQTAALFERFAGETLGARAGGPVVSGDAEVEGALAQRGVDAYHAAFPRYFFCAVCDFENGFLTVVSERLWASEVIRRSRSALGGLQVEATRPGPA